MQSSQVQVCNIPPGLVNRGIHYRSYMCTVYSFTLSTPTHCQCVTAKMADFVRRPFLTNFTVSRVVLPTIRLVKLSGLLFRSDSLCVYVYIDPVKNPFFALRSRVTIPAAGPLAPPQLLLPAFVDTWGHDPAE